MTAPTIHPADTTRDPRARRRSWRPDRDDAVDGVVIVGLVAFAMVGLGTIYDGIGALAVGLVGAVLGVVVGWVVVARALDALVSLALAAAVLLLGAGPATPDAATIGALPGPGTPAAVVDGLVHGWMDVTTTAPPVGLGAGLGMVPYSLAFGAGCLAMVLARRTTWSLAPAAPVTVALLVTLALGTIEPASTLVQGGLFALVALGWAAVRANRDRRSADGGVYWPRVAGGAAMLVSVLVIGVVAGPSLPLADASPRYVVRDRVVPPFDPRDYPSPLAAFRSYKLDGADEVYFTVGDLPEGARIRLATMDAYDGVVWVVSGRDVSGSGRFERVGSRILPVPDGESREIDVTVEAYEGVWVPTVGATRSIRFDGAQRSDLAEAFRYNRTTGTGASPSPIVSGDRYRLDASLAEEADPEELADLGINRSTVLPPMPSSPFLTDALTRVQERAFAIVGAGASPYDQALALEAELQRGAYTDGGDDATGAARKPAGHSLARLVSFLEADQLVGNAEQYASAMALMARQVGLPARVVLGFRPDGPGEVTGADADAWVEIRFEGAGWVPFDPTPDEDNQPEEQERTTRVEEELAQQEPPPEDYLDPPEEVVELTREAARRAGPEVGTVAGGGLPRVIVLGALYVGTPATAVALCLALVVGAKARRRRRRRNSGPAVARAAGAWSELMDRLVDLGHRPGRALTRREVAAEVGGDGWPTGTEYAALVDEAMFGPGTPDRTTVEHLWADLDRELVALRAPLTRRQRFRAAVSPASLRRRPRRAPSGVSS